jgi:2',3'-cyclic-nucleotide 2'-phosphodiesterase (5'-nucleotidase family)
LARRATFFDTVFSEGVSTLILDGGDLFGNRNRNDQHQTEFLLQCTADFGYDAIGLGEKDLNYGLDFLYKAVDEIGLPFTNANVRKLDTGELILPEYLVVEKNGIRFGIVSVLDPQQRLISMTDKDLGLEVQDPVPVLRELLPRVRKEADTIVLLGHLGDQTTDVVVKEVKGIDICVVGHTHRNLKTERILDDTVMLSCAFEGRYMGRADLFIEKSDGKVMAVDVNITSLDESIEDEPEMLARVNDYKDSLRAFKEAKRAAFPRIYGSEKENFLGERSCKGCHEDSWEAYATSAHRRAFNTLRNEGQNFEPECIVCHTTGYQYKNGYSDERPYSKLANVQCEACHGYGTEHARDGKWLAQAKDSCVTCHDKENSPDFDYATYWEKIKH